jgi:phage terminase large subunit GpA-like protein
MEFKDRFLYMLDALKVDFEYLQPSAWVEKYRRLSSEVSSIKGRFKYDNTPYTREIIDTLSPQNPAKVVGIMKGSQSGITEGLVVNGICWIIQNEPGNIIFLSANDELSKEIVETRLDQALSSTGIRHLIRPNTIRARNSRTGDTSKSKEFAGGRLFAGGVLSTDKMSRQRSLRYGFFDDWEAAPIADKEQGDLFAILQKRFSTSKNIMKQYYISTPETKPSNIERVYLMGDQRRWHVPCPRCGDYIEIKWTGKTKDGKKFGVLWETDEDGRLITESVHYKCQSCGGRIENKEKYEMNLHGKWVPTAKPQREGYVSYYLSNLMSASFMFGWKDFAAEWLDIYKNGNESKAGLKVFMNQTLGLPWEEQKESIKKNQLAQNTRDYDVGVVPNELSLKDGNGEILILTCACDLNGTLDDARLDYEVVGHSETGSTYSIMQGSVGTYGRGKKEDRQMWTYKNNETNNVWDYFYAEVVNRTYVSDDGREMKCVVTGVDTGYMTSFAYYFIDSYPGKVIGVKGKVDDKFRKIGHDYKKFKPAMERSNLWILEVDLLKDDLADMINLVWAQRGKVEVPQPPGFMNFPEPSEGQYTVNGYFKQYEAEQKVMEYNEDNEAVGYKWKRKHASSANHYFDCAVYNLALRNIFASLLCKELKIKYGQWGDFVQVAKQYM